MWFRVLLLSVKIILEVAHLLLNLASRRLSIPPMMSGLADRAAGNHGVPLHALVTVIGANDATREDLFGLVVEDPIRQEVSNVLGNAKPVPRTFLGGRPTVLIVKVKDGLVKLELEPGRNIGGNARAELSGGHGIGKALIGEDTMDLAEVLGNMEPGGIRGAGAIKDDVRMLFDVGNGTGFHGVLLGIIGLGKLVADVQLAVDGVDLGTLFLSCIVAAKARGHTVRTNIVTIHARKLPFSFETDDVHLG